MQYPDYFHPVLKLSSRVNMAARLKVGILGLALNPKRWTIGRLTSKAGEGREI